MRHSSQKIPREVIVLGVVSFLTDVSSEAIFAVLPMYFVAVVGGSAAMLGIMEGLADFASSSLDMASGYMADRTGKRKRIALFGYASSTVAKSLLLVTSSVVGVVAFRIVERLGKSVRGAPRDALLASVAPTGSRGLAFGIHKALDKAGAVLGPLLAYFVLTRMGVTARTFQWIFLGALIPAILAVVAMGLFVRERPAEHRRPRMPVRQTLAELGPRYWWYLAATSLFSLGYFSFAFLLLKAKAVNIGVEQQALLYGFFNLVFVLVSIPIGWIGDRLGRRTIVIASYLVYAAMCAGFLLADTQWAVLLLFALYGVFYAMDEGQAKAYLADLSHDEYRATAIGIYGFVSGLAYLPASIIAGWLWSYSPNWTFAFGILASLAASLAFAITSRGPAISTRPAS